MHEIDFLPAQYRQDHKERRRQTRRILVVVLLGTIVAAAASRQHLQRRQLEAELAESRPRHAEVTQERNALGELQSQLQAVRASADLYTYLRHPWPRTRILAALVAPLPDEIAFEELEIDQQTATGPVPANPRSHFDRKAEEEQFARLLPAARDLKRLRDQFDSRQTVVTVTGIATDSAAVHRYLTDLGRDDLFSKAELRSSEADPGDPRKIRFTATLVVRPGYGQLGGPAGSAPRAPAEADEKTT